MCRIAEHFTLLTSFGLRLFVVFYSSSHASSHPFGYVSKASLRLRAMVVYPYVVAGGLDPNCY